MVTGAQCNSAPFIGRNDVAISRSMLRNIGTNILQQRIRNAGKKINATIVQCFVKLSYWYHEQLIWSPVSGLKFLLSTYTYHSLPRNVRDSRWTAPHQIGRASCRERV